MASIGHVVAPGFPYHVMQDGMRRYTGMINSREGWRGHLWLECFHSFVMDVPHPLAAAR